MSSVKREIKRLARENTRLTKRNEELANANHLHQQALQNTLGTLVQGAMVQDNLTSFNPLIQSNIYAPLSLNYNILMYLYKTHGVLQTAIDEPVEDAFRGGLDMFSDELDAKDLGELQDFLEEHDTLGTVKNGFIWARLFGGGALVINVETDPMAPLDVRKLKQGRLEFYDAARWELGCKWRFDDSYEFYGKRLHPSRVLTLGNKRAPWIIRQQLSGWDMSEVERMVEDFNLFLRTRNVLYEILDEAKLDVFKFAGLREQLISDQGTEATRRRVALMNQLKNFQNALVLDKEDDYEQKQLTFSGISEIMKENRMGLASALRMPISKLFGVASSGFSSGEDDIENYNAMVEKIRERARPIVRKVLRLACVTVYGREYDINFKYRPLRVMSSAEEEQVKASKQRRIESFYDRGLVTSQEAAQWANKEELVPIETGALRGELDDHPVVPTMGEYREGGDDDEQKDKKKPQGDKDHGR